MSVVCDFQTMKISTPHRINASSDPFPRRPAPHQGAQRWAQACIGVSRGVASPRANMQFHRPRHDHPVFLEDFDFEANRWNGEPSPASRPSPIGQLKEQGANASTRERSVLAGARIPETESRLPLAARNSSALRLMTQEDKDALGDALTRNPDLDAKKWAKDHDVQPMSAMICASLILKKRCEASLNDHREARK